MPWQSVTLPATAEEADRLSDALMVLGAISVSIEDAAAGTVIETPIFGEPGMPPDALWRDNYVVALFEQHANVAQIIQTAAAEVAYTVPNYQIGHVAEQDWVRLTQAEFDPIRISDRLWIIPSWHQAPDDKAINLRLDPGLAFGTGSHPTTRLCLQWLDQNIVGGESVLDYGCGSGILAIAALKFGAVKAWGIDIDPQAITTAKGNAANNQVPDDFYLPDADVAARANIVVANILTNPLLALAPLLAERCLPRGKLVLSGILVEQAEKVISAYADWFDITEWRSEDGWVCLIGDKRT
ncbi:50S ribosomal protein L11 methyltransferase [Sulfuriferula sp. AH1]|uniref:50S ribosomal protein L11 methyltransferase n=1 Tax=Sulfuriferula sp. AH1 TaxID=1985873 RepID=UPI000B3B80BD|nr:50S ribosomal protein L11 methyltransferase [Sulfuriferula sp. AH1]ARU32747.1 50S ribosomal protein L11 methyltransferase [Sulfuriferula sp. AH1]